MKLINPNYAKILFWICIGASQTTNELNVKNLIVFPEEFILSNIHPTKFSWSKIYGFLLLDENRDEIIHTSQFRGKTLFKNHSFQNRKYKNLIWVGNSSEGIKLVDKIDNDVITFDYQFNHVNSISLVPKIYPELVAIGPWGKMFIYSKTYNGIFIYENLSLIENPFIDFSRDGINIHCLNDIESSFGGKLALLTCEGLLYEYERNGKLINLYDLNISNAKFIVSLKNDWLVFDDLGYGLAIRSGDIYRLNISNEKILDIVVTEDAIAALLKDKIITFNVKF